MPFSAYLAKVDFAITVVTASTHCFWQLQALAGFLTTATAKAGGEMSESWQNWQRAFCQR